MTPQISLKRHYDSDTLISLTGNIKDYLQTFFKLIRQTCLKNKRFSPHILQVLFSFIAGPIKFSFSAVRPSYLPTYLSTTSSAFNYFEKSLKSGPPLTYLASNFQSQNVPEAGIPIWQIWDHLKPTNKQKHFLISENFGKQFCSNPINEFTLVWLLWFDCETSTKLRQLFSTI